jgi:hypothetical protein
MSVESLLSSLGSLLKAVAVVVFGLAMVASLFAIHPLLGWPALVVAFLAVLRWIGERLGDCWFTRLVAFVIGVPIFLAIGVGIPVWLLAAFGIAAVLPLLFVGPFCLWLGGVTAFLFSACVRGE